MQGQASHFDFNNKMFSNRGYDTLDVYIHACTPVKVDQYCVRMRRARDDDRSLIHAIRISLQTNFLITLLLSSLTM
jgi:hypothetical protein